MAKDTKHYFKSGETLWNHRRETSDWHFDPTVKGEPNNLVNTEFVKFRGDWSEELKNTKYKEKAPLDIKNYLVRLGVQEHLNLGVSTYIEGSRATVDPTVHKKITKIVETFGIEKPYAQILLQKPGEMFTLHMDAICYDNFDRYKVTSIDQVKTDDSRVRVFVALEDWCWGQYLLMGNFHWTQWKAGDVIWFRWQDMPHASANAGHFPRPMLKITGKSTPKFEELLNGEGKIVNI